MSKPNTAAEKSIDRSDMTRIENPTEFIRLTDQCRKCKRELPSEIARVCGDNDGCIPECHHCTDQPAVTGSNRGNANTPAIAFRAHAEERSR